MRTFEFEEDKQALHWIALLTSAGHTLQVHLEASIIEVLYTMADEDVAIVRDFENDETEQNQGTGVKDRMWGRNEVLEAALEHGNMNAPIKDLVPKMKPLPTIHAEDTIQCALHTMMLNQCNHVGTTNEDGMITGVLRFSELYR